MTALDHDIDVVLIADRPGRASLLHDVLQEAGVTGVIRRITPGAQAVHCARQTGSYRNKALPDLFFVDFAEPDPKKISVLRKIAFGQDKSRVPVILMTSPKSQEMLDAGVIDGGKAVMFMPTPLNSFVGEMHQSGRECFFKALRTLFLYGPILVRTPEDVLLQEAVESVVPA